jgi:hypothetical protein
MRDPRTPGPGRAALVAAAVAAAVLLTVGVTASLGHRSGGPDTATQASAGTTGTAPPVRSVVDLDQGPVTDPADVAACLAPDFATDPAEVAVVYSQRQLAPAGTTPVLVLRNRAGELRLCDVFGGDHPASAPPGRATAKHLVAFFSNGRRDWHCAGHTLQRFVLSEWLSVGDPVHTVRLRFVVDGKPGPWFRTAAHGGLVHVQAWLDGPVHPGGTVRLQHRVLAADGTPVARSVLPHSQRLPGCEGGDVQIG